MTTNEVIQNVQSSIDVLFSTELLKQSSPLFEPYVNTFLESVSTAAIPAAEEI